MKTINQIFLYIIHSVYYMLGSALIFIGLCDSMFEMSVNFNILIILSMVFYFAIFILSDRYERHRDMDLLENKKFIAAAIAVSLISGVFLGFEEGLFMIIFTIGYFIIIMITAVKANRDDSVDSINSSVYFKMIKSFGLTVLLASFYVSNTKIIAFGNKVIDFIFTYFAVTIIYVICINFNKHYDSSSSINKDKNLFLFNFLAVFLISAFTFFRKQMVFAVKTFNEFITPGIDLVLDKSLTYVVAFIERIFAIDLMLFLEKGIGSGQGERTAEEVLDIEEGPMKLAEEVIETADSNILYNIIIVVLIIGLVFVLYKSLKSSSSKRSKKKGFEEKQFIFKRDDFLNDIKNSFKNIFKKKENLSAERLIYKQTVDKLISEGYEIYNTTTPNEYINSINSEDIEKYNFDNVTSDYNAYRYGKNNN